MDHQEVKDILTNLQSKQYIESEITHTFGENNMAIFSVNYSKNDNTFNITFMKTNTLEKFRDVDSAVLCISNYMCK
jgi:uncharacterized protein YkuJ